MSNNTKPTSPFALYQFENIENIAAEYMNKAKKDIHQQMSDNWQELDPQIKDQYKKHYDELQNELSYADIVRNNNIAESSSSSSKKRKNSSLPISTSDTTGTPLFSKKKKTDTIESKSKKKQTKSTGDISKIPSSSKKRKNDSTENSSNSSKKKKNGSPAKTTEKRQKRTVSKVPVQKDTESIVIGTENATNKRKRTNGATGKGKKKKFSRPAQTAVKVQLSKIIKKEFCDSEIKEAIRETVSEVTTVMTYVSRFLNFHFLQMLENGIEESLPNIDNFQSLIQRAASWICQRSIINSKRYNKLKEGDEELYTSWIHFSESIKVPKFSSRAQIINSSAREHKTAMVNHLVLNIQKRLFQFIYAKMEKKFPNELKKELKRVSNHCIRQLCYTTPYDFIKKPKDEIYNYCDTIIKEVKEMTTLSTPFVESTLKENIQGTIKLIWEIQKQLTTKKYSLLPLCAPGSRFIVLDKPNFIALVNNARKKHLIEIGVKSEYVAYESWNEFLDFKNVHIREDCKKLIKSIKTNSVEAVLVFKKDSDPSRKKQHEEMVYSPFVPKIGVKLKVPKSKIEVTLKENDALIPRIAVSINERIPEPKSSIKIKLKQVKIPNGKFSGIINMEDLKVADYQDKDITIIGIDPGNTNILSAVTVGKYEFKVITNREFKFKTREAYNRRLLVKWKKKPITVDGKSIEELEKTIKSPNVDSSIEMLEHCKSFFEVAPILHKFYFQRKILKQKWRQYRLRQKVIFDECKQLVPNPKTIIAFGAANFSTCMRGNAPHSRNRWIEELSKRALVVLVDEYNTTKLCSRCYQPLKSVMRSYAESHKKPGTIPILKKEKSKKKQEMKPKKKVQPKVRTPLEVEKKQRILTARIAEWTKVHEEKVKTNNKYIVRGLKKCQHLKDETIDGVEYKKCTNFGITWDRDKNSGTSIGKILKFYIEKGVRIEAFCNKTTFATDTTDTIDTSDITVQQPLQQMQ